VTIAAAPSAPAPTPSIGTLTPSSIVSAPGTTTYSYNFGTAGTVDATTSLTIGGVPLVIPGAGESLIDLQAQITGLAQAGVSANVVGNVLTITAPTAVATAMAGVSTVAADLAGLKTNFTFNTGGAVDPSTNLTITGQKADGTSAPAAAPIVTTGESITDYAIALNSAIAIAGITNVSVTAHPATGLLSIVGTDVTTNADPTHGVFQSLAATTTNYGFGSTSTVDSLTNLKITGQTAAGLPASILLPNITAGEAVSTYAADLNSALGHVGIVGVKASSVGGQLSIVGANCSITGNANQDLTATTISYSFGSSGGTVATVDPSTNFTITGLTPSGATATIIAPTVTSGETVLFYANALTNALAAAGITGVQVKSTGAGQLSIVGSNISSSGTIVQDPVGSANASGLMTFDSSGNLVSPAANVAGITFTGLTDGAASMNLTWDLLGSSGKPTISQVVGDSSASGSVQNGYASGAYNGFSIGPDGTVTASYSNGQTQAVGQLALANVTNLQGLELQGDGLYATTLASGAASIGVSGTNGLATIQGSALEQSNVNISAEFANLIIAQRGFEANSKAITTFDTITQETINMIH
jgi:flagellar hook protein FlgE